MNVLYKLPYPILRTMGNGKGVEKWFRKGWLIREEENR
jgi:hypothetical protein